ncbi:poly-beta-1,6-N-acetyl-D-glucosamine biosynthesis protein PgaD [Aquirhabdus sp.]|uniref:poly-beta-1,6-N-acetyl-D-glucosamine biosynthesis protein PgaD n=1 Tax=Aquirhabdus sp. TaxID=2824160 RepID=UPI00396C3607
MILSKNVKHLDVPQFIDRPELQSQGQRTTSAVLAMIGWTCWLYLFLPLLTIGGWLVSYRRVDQYIVQNQNGFYEQVNLLVPLVVIMGSLLLLWATYNWMRFRGESRRVASRNATSQEIAIHFAIPTRVVSQAQHCRVNVFHFDEAGGVVDIVGDVPVVQPIIRPQSKPERVAVEQA